MLIHRDFPSHSFLGQSRKIFYIFFLNLDILVLDLNLIKRSVYEYFRVEAGKLGVILNFESFNLLIFSQMRGYGPKRIFLRLRKKIY